MGSHLLHVHDIQFATNRVKVAQTKRFTQKRFQTTFCAPPSSKTFEDGQGVSQPTHCRFHSLSLRLSTTTATPVTPIQRVASPYFTMGIPLHRSPLTMLQSYERKEPAKKRTCTVARRGTSKHVHFETDGTNGEIIIREYPPCIYNNLEKSALWWTRLERKSIVETAKRTYQRFRGHTPSDCVDHYMEIYDMCCQAPSQATSDYLEDAALFVPDLVRGLEYGVMPETKWCRSQHVCDVLGAQDEMYGKLSANMAMELLGSRSLRSSRPSRVMARLLGESDENAVAAQLESGSE